jgi:hypothetical protein
VANCAKDCLPAGKCISGIKVMKTCAAVVMSSPMRPLLDGLGDELVELVKSPGGAGDGGGGCAPIIGVFVLGRPKPRMLS